MPETSVGLPTSVDVVVVGAGIVGLSHALEAHERGASVLVLERDDRPVGASVRNFGHISVTAQAGDAARAAERARTRWIEVAGHAGFDLLECGTVVVARAVEELAVLEEFADGRADSVELLGGSEVRCRAGVGDPEVLGGAFFPLDLRVDPRVTAPSIASWLETRGVRFGWSTNVLAVDSGTVRTNRGTVEAHSIVLAVNHDLDRFAPELAMSVGLRRCELEMLRVTSPVPANPDGPAVLTGSSMLRYDGFASCPSLGALRGRVRRERPELLEHVVNLMLTRRPDGSIQLGDTHVYAATLDPFPSESLAELLLDEASTLLGTDELAVQERWRGVYASTDEPFVVASPAPGVLAVTVGSGIGMSTALGLAAETIQRVL